MRIKITEKADEQNAQDYFKELETHIKQKRLQYTVFSNEKSPFISNHKLGFEVKQKSEFYGFYKYRLLLTSATNN